MPSALSWTAPYHGLQHLKPLKAGWQITVTTFESFSEVYVLAPGHGFTSVASEEFFNTKELSAKAARAWGENYAREHHLSALG